MALQIGKITFSRLGQGVGAGSAHGLSGHFGPFPRLTQSPGRKVHRKAADQPPLGHFLHRRCKPLVLYIGKGCITLLGQEGRSRHTASKKAGSLFPLFVPIWSFLLFQNFPYGIIKFQKRKRPGFRQAAGLYESA